MITLRVREVAESQGWTMQDLIRRSGLAESTVRGLWRYPGQHISTYTLDILADTLGVDARALIDYKPNREVG